MVTLKVTGNLYENIAKLDYHQLAQIRQAQYYMQKAMEIKNDVVMSAAFNANNPGAKNWTDAQSAVLHFIYFDNVKTEIIYD